MYWPEKEEAARLLDRLKVPEHDLLAVLELYPDSHEQPGWWPLLLAAHERLVGNIDQPGDVELRSADTGDLGLVEPLFGLYVLFSALPDILQWHRAHEIPEEISWATLADLGRQVNIYQRFHNQTGCDEYGWLSRHFRGLLFQLGRLQFERSWIQPQWRSNADLRESAGPSGRALGIHIPEAGPLSPHLCDESLAKARTFFTRHFPDEQYQLGTCDSWLLDEQLSEYLPPDSNIMRFQRRFTLLPDRLVNDQAVMRFIFYQNQTVLDDLPQSTSLQRAVVQHLRDGRHWYTRAGWLRLEAPERDRNDVLEKSG